MKANELMIGDWVFNTLNGEDEPHQMKAHEFTMSGLIYSARPIPITPEILEKNGFVYNALPFVQGWEQYGLTLTLGGDGFRVSCGQNVSMIIDFVHELQHALCLCRIEKEIII